VPTRAGSDLYASGCPALGTGRIQIGLFRRAKPVCGSGTAGFGIWRVRQRFDPCYAGLILTDPAGAVPSSVPAVQPRKVALHRFAAA
jgi:hypothetical protein